MSSFSSISSPPSLVSPNPDDLSLPEGPPSKADLGSASTLVTYRTSLASAKNLDDSLRLRPDDLFAKHTVSEVKAIQQRLRTDAEAKQEELRLMVGERYRDLLQASSSIISIASSSQRVVEALKESKDAILSQHPLPVAPQTAAVDGLDDRHLYTLQVLSAHIKILLDAPEQLWHLIERKKYLQAAWLFLLARVVHRALVRNEDNDEQSWAAEGVDVLVEFPLVQRQWDVVSQFRSQIIHKSTLSLREASASIEDTCATLTTLHLLDSWPLSETLTTLLLQRSKTLQSLLSWNRNPNNNDRTPDKPFLSVRGVIRAMRNVLTTIFRTVCTARTIFQDDGSRPSLILRLLESIQAEYLASGIQSADLPIELLLSTKSLLTQLTSSATFQLLPPNLRSYKPYIDLNSSSLFLPLSEFCQKLQEWFHNSCKQWEQSSKQWLSGLQSVRDVWSLSSSLKRCILESDLEKVEKEHVYDSLDILCHARIAEIWQRALSDAEVKFKESLRENTFSFKSRGHSDTSPLDFLFQPSPIPVLSQIAKSFVDASFQKYQLSLKKQLLSRSSRLDSVISTLEHCARVIQTDFTRLIANGDGKITPIVQRLHETYEPAADELIMKVISFVDEVATEAIDTNSDPNALAFLSRVATDLVHVSLFSQYIGCSRNSAQEFRQNLDLINDRIIEKWRQLIIEDTLRSHPPQKQKQSSYVPGPSPRIFEALLFLCDSIRQLGVFNQSDRRYIVTQDLLRSLIVSWIRDNPEHMEVKQTAHDLAFLRAISHEYGQSWIETTTLLDEKLKAMIPDDGMLVSLSQMASDHLKRTQTLLAILLPLRSPVFEAPFLVFGIPSSVQTHAPAIDLAKPSPRFGMLLVGNADH